MTNQHAFRHIAHMGHVRRPDAGRHPQPAQHRDNVARHLRGRQRVVTMAEFREIGPEGVARLVPRGEDCYISLDVDVLDLSLVPGCVSAEPDGLSYAELRDTLIALTEQTRIVGMDLVEVNPMLDVGHGRHGVPGRAHDRRVPRPPLRQRVLATHTPPERPLHRALNATKRSRNGARPKLGDAQCTADNDSRPEDIRGELGRPPGLQAPGAAFNRALGLLRPGHPAGAARAPVVST